MTSSVRAAAQGCAAGGVTDEEAGDPQPTARHGLITLEIHLPALMGLAGRHGSGQLRALGGWRTVLAQPRAEARQIGGQRAALRERAALQARAARQLQPQLIDEEAAMLTLEPQQHVLEARTRRAQRATASGPWWAKVQAGPAVLLVDPPELADETISNRGLSVPEDRGASCFARTL